MVGSDAVEDVHCPACGPSQTRVWTNDRGSTRFLRCTSCYTVFASPRAPFAARYRWIDETFSPSDELDRVTRARMPALRFEAEVIQRRMTTGRILDVGCSIGLFLDLFPSVSWQRFGVEVSPAAAEYARRAYGHDVRSGLLRAAAFGDQCFDVATVIDTLYYLDEPATDFLELHRLLRPGGILAVEVSGQAYALCRNYGVVPRLLDGRWSRAPSDSSYLHWFSVAGLELLLAKTGFEATEWHVVPSPRNDSRLVRASTTLHFRIASVLVKLSKRSLAWAPKYLCVARRN